MSQRVLIQLATPGHGLPPRIGDILSAAGASDVREPHRELSGLFVAVLADGTDVDALLAQLRSQPEVRAAEIERFRSAS